MADNSYAVSNLRTIKENIMAYASNAEGYQYSPLYEKIEEAQSAVQRLIDAIEGKGDGSDDDTPEEVREALEYVRENMNDYIQIGEGEGTATMINGKPVEPKRHEPECVWVCTAEQAWDGDVADTIVKAFKTEKAATDYLHDFIHEDGEESIVNYVKRNGWETEVDEPDLYRACCERCYESDHIECTVTKCEIEH